MTLKDILNVKTVTMMHDTIIDTFGGTKGTQNENMILSALGSAFQTFTGQDLYPTHIEKAGIVFFSLIKNHGFVDGNKRTACLMLSLILHVYNYCLNVTNSAMEKVALRVAENKIAKEEVFLWIYHSIDYTDK